MLRYLTWCAIPILAACAADNPVEPGSYLITIELGTLPGDGWSEALGVNDLGWVVGRSSSERFGGSKPFVWRAEHGMRPLKGLGQNGGFAVDINNRGVIAGMAIDSAGIWHAVLWRTPDAEPTPLQIRGAPCGINERGEIAIGGERVLLWTPDGVRDLTDGAHAPLCRALNDAGHVVGSTFGSHGTSSNIGGRDATIFTDQGRVGLAGVVANDINNLGEVAGRGISFDPGYWTAEGSWRELPGDGGGTLAINDASELAGRTGGIAAAWRDGELIPLGRWGGSDGWSSGERISNRGHVVGRKQVDEDKWHAMLWILPAR